MSLTAPHNTKAAAPRPVKMTKSGIDYVDHSWNVITGCDPISPACANCYALKIAHRMQANPRFNNSPHGNNYANGTKVTFHQHLLAAPGNHKTPSVVFVCAMSDLFHQAVTDAEIQQIFEVMNQNPQHYFLTLTKRSARLAQLAPQLTWTSNIGCGVTVESMGFANRLDDLRQVPATMRFVSAEPLLGSLKGINLSGINWIIAGGESAPRPRRMKASWARELRDEAERLDVPFFFKQWSHGRRKHPDPILNLEYHRYVPMTWDATRKVWEQKVRFINL